ncbi:hypothetical protein [Streptomyces sp. NPDC048636]|uniref:hypothetical protein n=1 Tax=Streptomyces sp. NPDC048636 TaxID=3155762 RepID=UPI0034428C72
MPFLHCEAVRWVGDEPFPGLVEVCFTDAHHQQRSVIDKAPVFDDSDALTPTADYPVTVNVLCDILQRTASHSATRTVTVSLAPWGLESVDGDVEFQVRADQLTTS